MAWFTVDREPSQKASGGAGSDPVALDRVVDSRRQDVEFAGAAGGFAYNRYGAAKERRAENRQSALRQARVAAPADAPKQSAADRRFEEYVQQMDRSGKKGNRTVF